MADVIVDTDILIDVVRSIPEAITYVQNLERGAIVGISSITYMELLIGCRNETEQRKAVAMLTRSIINHIPPIFGAATFSEFANNYPGSKSFKDSMQHLSNSLRKIADSHLHVQIRKKESLPNSTQVNFANDLDVLLSEIVRNLK